MKRLYRSVRYKKIAGVCGGLGEYFDIDPTLIRLGLLFLCFITAVFPVLIAYITAILFVPIEPSKEPVKKFHRLYRSKKNKILGGICGGIAEFFEMDPTVVRLIFIFLLVITAVLPMLLTYLIGLIVIPEKSRSFEDIEIKKK